MARKKKQDDGAAGSWLNTYADMVTLLLTFFILLYSMSSLDQEKYEMLVEAFSSGANVIVAPDDYDPGDSLIDDGSTSETPVIDVEDLEGLDILYEMISKYVEDNQLQNDVLIEKSDDSVFIRFKNNIFFDGYSSILKDSGKDILDVVAGGIDEAEFAIEEIIVAGHTATVEGDNTNIDRILSSERAYNVLIYLQERNMFDPAKLVSVGYGRFRPIATNDTSEGRAENRRVEIYITKKGVSRSFTDYIYDILEERNSSSRDVTESGANDLNTLDTLKENTSKEDGSN